ncbi:two-component system response regulator YesN [Evansella vedderi]|uniref:Two-component system response regulator YesN n=1 Tax=Evansella vedderi TaxID=38282 RepID=A0ABT9ZY67_9BACI|nr:response regulator [Evansella vedderi]MDQ0255905.1 two-component system response regulator YesN [Evansella vedderi]
MYKVVLVDDEIYVRQGLASLIEWEKCGYEIVAEADNGEDAFQIIKDTNPDVVITDIRMPVVDGLSLIQNVKEKFNSNIKFIIISGYNDFSYAQKAVRYGVFDFVLKPIDQDELESTLLKLAEKLQTEKVERSKKGKLLLDQIFAQSLDGNDNEIREWATSLNLDESEYFYYLLIEINNLLPNEPINSDENIKSIKPTIKETVVNMGKSTKRIALYEQQDNAVGILITSEHLQNFNGNIEAFADRLKNGVKKKIDKPITVYAGAKVTDLLSLKKSYDTANSIRNYKYINDKTNVIIYDQVEKIPVAYSEINEKLYLSLMEQIEENNTKEIEKVVEQIFTEFKTRNFAPGAIRTSINRCVHGVIQTVNSMDGDEKKIISIGAMTQWEKYNLTLKELKKVFTTFVIEGAVIIQELRKVNMKGDIYKVKSYVENNYHQNISLKSIASKFFMNPVYMGQLFKKTFGIYFKEYLLSLRIDEAKKLLRQTDLRVYEVAEKVGFGSTDYFVTQFEKINKMTPTEYRNQLLKK